MSNHDLSLNLTDRISIMRRTINVLYVNLKEIFNRFGQGFFNKVIYGKSCLLRIFELLNLILALEIQDSKW